MPDGSIHADIAAAPVRASKPVRQRCQSPSATALVGNATGLIFRLNEVEAHMARLDLDPEEPCGRHSHEGRALQRQAKALVDLAIELEPVNMTDVMALIAALYEKVGDVCREERSAEEMGRLLEAPMNAIERIGRFLAPELGLTISDFASNYTCLGDAS